MTNEEIEYYSVGYDLNERKNTALLLQRCIFKTSSLPLSSFVYKGFDNIRK